MTEILTWKDLHDAFVAAAPTDTEYIIKANIEVDPDNDRPWGYASIDGSAGRVKINGNGKRIGSRKKPMTEQLFDRLQYVDIDNLKVFTKLDGLYMASVAAVARAVEYSNFTNITVNGKMNISVYTDQYGAGIAGHAWGCKFSNCTNNADISNTGYRSSSGGIVGRAMDYCLFYSCKNTGNIEAPIAGGIACEVESSQVISCQNSGSISGYNAGGSIELAGIAARVRGTNDILDNINSGCIGSDGVLADIVGGIVANLTNLVADTQIVISNNINTCTVKGGRFAAGGIIGYKTYQASAIIIVSENDDIGNVTGSEHSGGIIGMFNNLSPNSQIVNNRVCANKVEVTDAAGHVGGVIGNLATVSPGLISQNYVNIKNLLGTNETSTHWIVGNYPTGSHNFSDNYYDDTDSTTTPDPLNCATYPELCGDPIDPDAHTLPVGDSLSNCMRAVWDETDCGTTGQSSAS
ncbi:MAG: hypothetical protein LBD16_06020, partial [Oscillospiraceae bacterium]|nr:hypothetical protein [Oscillospiraceae bacterium]